MGHKASQGNGILIGFSVVASAAATVYFVTGGYSRHQQNQAIMEQYIQKQTTTMTPIVLPPPKDAKTAPNPEEKRTMAPALTEITSLSPTPTISSTGSIAPTNASTVPAGYLTGTPLPTSIQTPGLSPTPSQTHFLDAPTPSQTRPSSTPTPIPPTSTILRIPTVDPKLCKLIPEHTSHPHYCTPTAGAGGP